jgi:hypothetical protein
MQAKLPAYAVKIKEIILAEARDDHDKAVFESVFNDRRLAYVSKELMAESRNSPGMYLHPAVDNPQNRIFAQQRACAKVFDFTIFALRNPVSVSKREQVGKERDEILARAAVSREFADRMAAAAIGDPEIAPGAGAAMRLAQEEEMHAQHLIAQMRTCDDPLVVCNDRGDPWVRGIVTMTTCKLREIYGKDLYKIAATIAEVITGQTVSKQAARSAAEKNKAKLSSKEINYIRGVFSNSKKHSS